MMKFIMPRDVKKGRILFDNDGEIVLGAAAKDIKEGELVDFIPGGNTDHILTQGEAYLQYLIDAGEFNGPT